MTPPAKDPGRTADETTAGRAHLPVHGAHGVAPHSPGAVQPALTSQGPSRVAGFPTWFLWLFILCGSLVVWFRGGWECVLVLLVTFGVAWVDGHMEGRAER